MTAGKIDAEAILELAPETRARYDGCRHVLVDSPGGAVVDAGPPGFALLSLFSRPTTFAAAIERAEVTPGLDRDLVVALGVVFSLVETGALEVSEPELEEVFVKIMRGAAG